jgi:two-component sensor histidine kinase
MMIQSLNTAANCLLPVSWVKPGSRARQMRDGLSESDAHAQLLGSFFSAVPSTLQQAVEIARKLFKADAAGLHLCGHEESGLITRADVIAGALSMHEGSQPSFGCGLCKKAVHAGAPIVLSEQEIELTYLRHIEPRVVHVLMAPIYDGAGKALGVIWLAQITSPVTYSRTDTLALERLTHVLAARLAVWEKTNELEALRATIESERITHSNAVNTLTSDFEHRLVHDDLVVREAHHRVKNTLQIVSSLLRLQAKSTDQNEAADALREASSRLQVLMHAHEDLYRAGIGRQEISLGSLLNTIAKTLPPSFAETSSRVSLELTTTDIYLPPAEASAIAIIANEVLTNAYKHAFPHSGVGSISVQLERDSESAVILRISDTGTGAHVQPASETFGVWLVHKLAQQLGATVECSRDKATPGTHFVLKVPPGATIYSGNSNEHDQVKHVLLAVRSSNAEARSILSGANSDE